MNRGLRNFDRPKAKKVAHGTPLPKSMAGIVMDMISEPEFTLQGEPDERKKFEAWHHKTYRVVLNFKANGKYSYHSVQARWEAWLAAVKERK